MKETEERKAISGYILEDGRQEISEPIYIIKCSKMMKTFWSPPQTQTSVSGPNKFHLSFFFSLFLLFH